MFICLYLFVFIDRLFLFSCPYSFIWGVFTRDYFFSSWWKPPDMYHVVHDGFWISLCSKFKLCLTNNTWFLLLKHVQTIPPPKHSVAPGIANIYQFMAWKFPDKINKDCGPWEAARRWISDEGCIPVERPLYGKGFDGSGEAGTWMSFFMYENGVPHGSSHFSD